MSYILDALRKADAERERDPARGIHAQPLAGAETAPAPARPALWLVAGAAGVVVAGVAFYALQDQPATAPIAAGPLEAAPAAPVPVAAVTVAAPVPAKPPPVANVVEPPAPPPLPAPAVVPPKPVAKLVAATPAKAVTVAAASQPQAAQTATAAKDAPLLKAPAATVAERIYALAELPPDVQRELPKLVISGGVHSENAAQRMLIVGGQVVNEGAELAPGVVLEQIRSRAAVLRFKGWRYRVAY